MCCAKQGGLKGAYSLCFAKQRELVYALLSKGACLLFAKQRELIVCAVLGKGDLRLCFTKQREPIVCALLSKSNLQYVL